MSKEQDILILEASLQELRLTHALVGTGPVKVLQAGSFALEEKSSDKSAIEDQVILDRMTKYVAEQGWAGRQVLCLLGGSAVSCQYFDMPPLKGNCLRNAVLLKLGQRLPFAVDEALVDIHPLKRQTSNDGDDLRVAATAIRREVVRSAIGACEYLKLDVSIVSAMPAALAALARSTIEDCAQMQAVLHVGEQTCTLVVFQGKKPCVTSEIEIGLHDFTAAMMRPIIDGDSVIQLDDAKAEALRDEIGIPKAGQQIESIGVAGSRLLPLLEPILQKLAHQLTQWLTFAATSCGTERVARLRLVGSGAMMAGLSEAVGSRVEIDVDQADWLDGVASCSDTLDPESLCSCAAAVAAATHQKDLPDLTPRDVRNQRRLRRIRRSTVLAAPVLAAAVFGLSVLFDNVIARSGLSQGVDQAKLVQLQRISRSHDRQNAEQRFTQQLQKQFDDFARATPRWDGLFKELARALPQEVQVTEFRARTEKDDIHVTMQARVYTRPQGWNFDQVVEQTLRALEGSPFFKRVLPLSSNRAGPGEDSPAAGTLSVELELAYPRSGAGA